MAGRVFQPKDNEVLRNMDMYLTTNQDIHRFWNPDELNGIGKKDAATYWDLEDYPKAWGFGLKTKYFIFCLCLIKMYCFIL